MKINTNECFLLRLINYGNIKHFYPTQKLIPLETIQKAVE
jgi:aspartate carbamoyltransferase catalytic subunit